MLDKARRELLAAHAATAVSSLGEAFPVSPRFQPGAASVDQLVAPGNGPWRTPPRAHYQAFVNPLPSPQVGVLEAGGQFQAVADGAVDGDVG